MQAGPQKINLIKILAAGTVLFALTGCAFEKNKAGEDSVVLDPEAVGFPEVKATSLQKCMECHAAWMGSYATLVPNLTEIARRVQLAGPGQMPPPGKAPLSDNEKQVLLRWIERGAPEAGGTTGAPAPVIPPKPVLAGFPSPQREIFASKCVRCHKSIMANLDAFQPYLADAASRISSELDFERMPPPNRPQLTEDELNNLLTWLKEQAEN